MTIHIPASPTAVERSAARELADALARVTGERPAVVSEDAPAAGRAFFIGATRRSARLRAAAGIDSWRHDEVLLARDGDAQVVDGDPARGPIYAADVYLERFLGVRWWTSTESFHPRIAAEDLPHADFRHAPPFKYREAYYLDGLDPLFKVRSKVNFSSIGRYEPATPVHPFIPPELGGNYRLHFFEGRRSAYHSFFEILPPAEHFERHPEWYSLIGGRRDPKQLCLTNAEMREAFIAETLRRLGDDPGANFIQVSQNDWQGACECDACRAVEEQEGGAHSGLYLRFVNAVAEAVEARFPNVTVDTFAYQFTRKAPSRTRPRSNVVVRLCDIECAFNRPLAEFPHNRPFMEDLRDWSRIAPGQLFVWDYLANFRSYMLPHMNLRSIAPNIRTFAEAGVVGLFEQGDVCCAAGELAPLRFWLVSHLLWDPAADEAALADEFIRGYYGEAAAPHIWRYIDIVNAAAEASGKPMRCYHENVTDWLSRTEIEEAAAAMSAALAAAEGQGPDCARRVRREKLSTDHMLMRNWIPEYGDLAAFTREWVETCRSYGVIAAAETVDPRQFEEYSAKLLAPVAG